MTQGERPERGLLHRGRSLGIARRTAFVAFLAVLGPGLITASADNDAQGITTYSIVGARFGYELLWLTLLAGVALLVTQEVGARIGIVTGKGLAALIRERFGARTAAIAMALLVVANLGTTAAEFAGMAAALQVFHVSRYIAVPVGAALVMLLILRGSFRRIERVFLVMSLVYIAYVISGVLAHPDWNQAFHDLFIPTVQVQPGFILAAVAMVGTTVTPWGQFFIQAYVVDKALGPDDLTYERIDVGIGATATVIVMFFIVVATAATIHATGGSIVDAGDAAAALEPLAGRFAAGLFALGLLNASILAAGILPLSTSYATCEAFGFEMGLDRGVRDAPVFYGVFIGAIVIGAGLVLLPGVSLVPVLFLSAVVNGVLLAPILIYLGVLANDRELMGERRNGRAANALLVATVVLLLSLTAVLIVAAIAAI
jgi:NRAMP (natural resistance-associated macrophage protein)-like metal ion transporter